MKEKLSRQEGRQKQKSRLGVYYSGKNREAKGIERSEQGSKSQEMGPKVR